MTFRDQATADLPTFINVDEFGDIVSIDGVAVACVREDNGDTQGTGDGVINQDTIIRARTSSFYNTPVVGQRFKIDDRQGDVVGVLEAQGIVELRIRWLDS